MFDRAIVTKTYKFIIIDKSACEKDGYSSWKEAGTVYTFANAAPRGYGDQARRKSGPYYKWKVLDFFENSTLDKAKKWVDTSFLKRNTPATEANITKAMVEKWSYEVKNSKRLIKNSEADLRSYRARAKGKEILRIDRTTSIDISVVERDLERKKEQLEAYKNHLKLWRTRFKELEKKGVYVWAALCD